MEYQGTVYIQWADKHKSTESVQKNECPFKLVQEIADDCMIPCIFDFIDNTGFMDIEHCNIAPR